MTRSIFRDNSVFDGTGADPRVAALRGWCAEIGRDPAEIEWSVGGEDALAGVAEEIRGAGGLAIPVVADVTDRAAVEAAVATVAMLGAIGILVLSPNGGTVFPG